MKDYYYFLVEDDRIRSALYTTPEKLHDAYKRCNGAYPLKRFQKAKIETRLFNKSVAMHHLKFDVLPETKIFETKVEPSRPPIEPYPLNNYRYRWHNIILEEMSRFRPIVQQYAQGEGYDKIVKNVSESLQPVVARVRIKEQMKLFDALFQYTLWYKFKRLAKRVGKWLLAPDTNYNNHNHSRR